MGKSTYVRLLHVRTLYSCASERVKLTVLQVGRWIMLPIPGRLVRNRMMLCGADVMHVRLPWFLRQRKILRSYCVVCVRAQWATNVTQLYTHKKISEYIVISLPAMLELQRFSSVSSLRP